MAEASGQACIVSDASRVKDVRVSVRDTRIAPVRDRLAGNLRTVTAIATAGFVCYQVACRLSPVAYGRQPQPTVYGLWPPIADCLRHIAYSLPMACGVWCVAFGVWLVAIGVWRVACGVWLAACDAWAGPEAHDLQWPGARGAWPVADGLCSANRLCRVNLMATVRLSLELAYSRLFVILVWSLRSISMCMTLLAHATCARMCLHNGGTVDAWTHWCMQPRLGAMVSMLFHAGTH